MGTTEVNLTNISSATMGALIALLDTVECNPGIVYPRHRSALSCLRSRIDTLDIALQGGLRDEASGGFTRTGAPPQQRLSINIATGAITTTTEGTS